MSLIGKLGCVCAIQSDTSIIFIYKQSASYLFPCAHTPDLEHTSVFGWCVCLHFQPFLMTRLNSLSSLHQLPREICGISVILSTPSMYRPDESTQLKETGTTLLY